MRFGVEGLCSPRPFMDTMPSVYRGDPLAQQLCAAFDDVLAPIFATLDCFPAYLDPKTRPERHARLARRLDRPDNRRTSDSQPANAN